MTEPTRLVDGAAPPQGIPPRLGSETDPMKTGLVASGPVIVGVDGSERSIDALALADLLGPALRRPVLIAHVHPFQQLSSLFAPGQYERIVREIAETTFEQVRGHLSSDRKARMRLVSAGSTAAGLQALSEREDAALIVIGSSHRSRIGRVLVGGTGERLLSGAPAPVAVAPAGYADAARLVSVVGCGFDGSSESYRALAWASEFASSVPARLRVLSVHERTLPASLAVGGGLPTASVNEVLRSRREEELAGAVAALDPEVDASQQLLDGDPGLVLASESSRLDLLVVGSRGYGPLRAVLVGSVASALVRSAHAPLLVVPRSSGEDHADQGTTSPPRNA